jgi:hypothetical protein
MLIIRITKKLDIKCEVVKAGSEEDEMSGVCELVMKLKKNS